jgi:leucyl aminopeptidase
MLKPYYRWWSLMHAIAENKSFLEKGAELLLLPVFQDEKPGAIAAKADSILGGVIAALSKKEFSGKPGTAVLLRGTGKLKRVLLFGLGKRPALNNDSLRQAGGRLAATAMALCVESVAFALPDKVDAAEATIAAVEGVMLGAYRFDKYFTDPEAKAKPVKSLAVIGGRTPKEKQALEYATIVSECSNFARELSNESGSNATPAVIARRMQEYCKVNSVSCRVLDAADAKKLGMGSFLSVAAGSVQPAKFVVMEYKGKGAKGKPIALVGKGITFDSGGISIKPSGNMDKMKHDKSGACAVVGAMAAVSRLKLPLHVVGVCPLSENLPSGSATKPGDIVKAMNGKTIEILNTDAEGRLVLADALAYAVEKFKPTAVIDIATLTGACFVALGDVRSGLMGNDDALQQKIMKAGEIEWERCWMMPMDADYDEKVKSTVADVKNIGGAMGDSGVMSGSSFLKLFVGETKWAHLDIAGTGWAEREKPYFSLGATGVGVRLFARMLKDWKG